MHNFEWVTCTSATFSNIRRYVLASRFYLCRTPRYKNCRWCLSALTHFYHSAEDIRTTVAVVCSVNTVLLL